MGRGWRGRLSRGCCARADLLDQVAGELHWRAGVAVAEVRENVDLDVAAGFFEPYDAHAILVCGDGAGDILSDIFKQSLSLRLWHFFNIHVHDQQQADRRKAATHQSLVLTPFHRPGSVGSHHAVRFSICNPMSFVCQFVKRPNICCESEIVDLTAWLRRWNTSFCKDTRFQCIWRHKFPFISHCHAVSSIPRPSFPA